MKDLLRRVAKMEAAHPTGAARRYTSEEAASAHAELTQVLDAIAAEKVAGDAHGIAARQIAALLAASEQIAAERRA